MKLNLPMNQIGSLTVPEALQHKFALIRALSCFLTRCSLSSQTPVWYHLPKHASSILVVRVIGIVLLSSFTNFLHHFLSGLTKICRTSFAVLISLLDIMTSFEASELAL